MKLLSKLRGLFSFLFSNKLILSLSSFYLFILFYLISNEIIIFNVTPKYNYIIYILFGFVFSVICLISVLSKKETDKQSEIESVKPLEFIYISIYLGLFIISLSLNNFSDHKIAVSFIIILIYLIWLKLENTSFFNLFWLFLGYRFYEITTKKSTYTLITRKKDVKNKDSLKDLRLKRINNFTFIEAMK